MMIGLFKKKRGVLECWNEWHPESAFIPEYLMRAEGKDDISLRKVGNGTLARLKTYINAQPLSNNTKRRYYAQFKAFFGLHERETSLSGKWRDILSQHPDKCTYLYLSAEDVKRIAQAPVMDDQEEAARDTFVIGCLTGARISDYSQFRPENVNNGVLTYVSKKTGQYARIPACGLLIRMMQHSKAFTVKFTGRYLNIAIKRIAKRAGLSGMATIYQGNERVTAPKYELISSHTARRSFCRNLREYNAELETIRDFAGHSNIAMTERYIGRGVEFKDGKRPSDFFSYFN